ncbi:MULTISPECIES: class I SAM-dependent methyltransferase [Paenibacillus]|uniref:class I SAM-dependent methyltransferase n=1 Tax=Paenibacillus TaxID=44249 RepID=UPI0022B87B0D|nr:class I SAM-dependent methyltransferase [Paenibacillus caseinilyticus]MCZ8523941.1 methyltransferase domain-containing protein [Paenibacillus caseinilyticus]
MGFLSILSFAHKLVEERVRPRDTAVDATAGNGNDTVFLARLVGSEGSVHAFDIQPRAIEQTAQRLRKELPELEQRVHLHLRSHGEMDQALPEMTDGLAAAMFNLGYLPGDDHATVTLPETTLEALAAAARLLRRGGIITAVLYTGHPGGLEEAEAVERWAAALPQREYQVLQYRFINQVNTPPYVIAIEKRN